MGHSGGGLTSQASKNEGSRGAGWGKQLFRAGIKKDSSGAGGEEEKQLFRAGIKNDSPGPGGEEGDRSVLHSAEDGSGTKGTSSDNGKRSFPVSSSYSKQDGRNYPRMRPVSSTGKSNCADSKLGSGRLGKNEMWSRPPHAVLGQGVSQGTRAKLWGRTSSEVRSSFSVTGVPNTSPSSDQAKSSVASKEKIVRGNTKPLGSAFGSKQKDLKCKANSSAGVGSISNPPFGTAVGNGANASVVGGGAMQNEVHGGTTNHGDGGQEIKINTVRGVMGTIIEEEGVDSDGNHTVVGAGTPSSESPSPDVGGTRVAWHPSQIGDSFGDEETDRIHMIQGSVNSVSGQGGDSVFPPPPLILRTGETAEYLSPFVRAVGGEITLDRRRHTTKVQVFAGARAQTTLPCEALLDTGSPASFIQERCVNRMLACGSASIDGIMTVSAKHGGAFMGYRWSQNAE